MPAISASAPGKVILCGEHAVVYGKAAIALPVREVNTRTIVTATPAGRAGEVLIIAPSIELKSTIDHLDAHHPLALAVRLVQEELGISHLPACEVRISTTISIASGLGSSASVTVSLLRALSAFLGHPFPDETVNRLAFEVEKVNHGTPSGIDNTVITFNAPIFYQKALPFEKLQIRHEFTLVIADSGSRGSTVEMVGGVHQRWLEEKSRYESLFNEIDILVRRMYHLLQEGNIYSGGDLLNQNHRLLQEIGVSTSQLDGMVVTALSAGALGAKLSGGGGGGNIIALVEPLQTEKVTLALKSAGASNIIQTTIPSSSGNKP